MAAADPVFESLQRFQSMMESFDQSLSQLCKDNSSESALDLRKNLMDYCHEAHDLHKALQSRYENLKIKEKKLEESGTRGRNKESETSKVTGLGPASSVEVRPEIQALCDKADGRGLGNYIVNNVKDVETLRNELLVALGKAPDPGKLVIKALEGFDLSKSSSPQRKRRMMSESLSPANANACTLLLECLYPVFGNDHNDVVPSDVKDSAREIAKVWRKKMFGETKKIQKNAYSARKFDVQAFLQLVATFRLAADYKQHGLWLLARAILRRKQTPELCRSLGLSSKIPTLDIISDPDLVLRYAHVCGVMDKINPVVLLTSYLRRAGRGAKMVYALERVMKLIKEYGLQSHFGEEDLQNKLRILVQENEDLTKRKNQDSKIKPHVKEHREKDTEKKAQEEEDRKKATEKKLQEEVDRKTAAEKKAQEEEDRKKAAQKELQEKEDREKAAEKKAQEEKDRKKATEKKLQEEIDRNKATEKKLQEEVDRKKAADKKAQEEEDRKKAAEKELKEKEDKEKAAEKKAQEEKDRKKAAEKKAQEKEDREKAAGKKAQETEDEEKAAEKSLQHKRHQSFEPGYGPSERENYASKRAKHVSMNVTTRVAGGMGNSKASPYNIDGVQKKSGIIGYDHHTSAFSAANRSSTGPAAGAFTSASSIAAQINDERRHWPSGTSNLTPIGSSLYDSSAPVGAFAVPLYNVAEVNYEGRGQQSYTMNPGEVDKNHVRASVYGTEDLVKSSATQSNYNYEGRGQQICKLNFVQVGNNPVSTSAYGTGVLANSSATQTHYERRGPELYTSAFGVGNTGNIGPSVYGSSSCIIPSSDVNQGGHERTLGQYSGYASRNMVPIESSGYGPGVSTVPPSNVTQGLFESRSVIDKYRFNSGSY